MRDVLRQLQHLSFPCGNTGAQMGGWFRKEIKGVADLKGLKIRIGGLAGKVHRAPGRVPQNMPAGEIYQALEKGTHGRRRVGRPLRRREAGLHKVAPFYYYPGWWEAAPQLEFFINQKAYDALSPEYQAIVDAATRRTCVT